MSTELKLKLQKLSKESKVLIIGSLPITEIGVWNDIKTGIFKDGGAVVSLIVESDNDLFQKSLKTDTPYVTKRITLTELKFRRDNVIKEAKKNNITCRISHLQMSANIIAFGDDEIWYCPIFGESESLESFILTSGSTNIVWYHTTKRYLDNIKDQNKTGKYLSKPGEELLELFDQDNIPRGIFPRDCFYNTDFYQYVVWGLVFNRDGKLLIHKRSVNAKDNQGMWDKSIGGHVDFAKERSSAAAVIRELIEELFTDEKVQQTGHIFSLLKADSSKIWDLGDCPNAETGDDCFNLISNIEKLYPKGEEPWFMYKAEEFLQRNTPRMLPDKDMNGNVIAPKERERKLRVLADVFIFISNTTLTEESANKMKNSSYRLIDIPLLKTHMENRTDYKLEEFVATPDLTYIMESKIREILELISQLIKYSDIRKP